MSDQITPNADTTANADAKPKAKKSTSRAQAVASMRRKGSFDPRDLAVARMRAQGITGTTPEDYAKAYVRPFLRKNKATLAKKDKAVRTHAKNAPWTNLNVATFDAVVNGKGIES
jgi:predicted metal-dependent hydrolase